MPRLPEKKSSTAAFAAPVRGAMLLLRCAAAAGHPALERTPTLRKLRVRSLLNFVSCKSETDITELL